jgi:hypothetical protein
MDFSPSSLLTTCEYSDHINHRHAPVRMTMSNGDDPLPGHRVFTDTVFDWLEEQLWFITPVFGENDTYYIQNLRSGTYLEMSEGFNFFLVSWLLFVDSVCCSGQTPHRMATLSSGELPPWIQTVIPSLCLPLVND